MTELRIEGYAAGWVSSNGAFLAVPPHGSDDVVHETREGASAAIAVPVPDIEIRYVRREFHIRGWYFAEMFRIIMDPGHSR